jgi:hypothetical protein
MANSKTILIASFALFALIGLYVLVDNGASLLQLAFVAFSIITVVALTENAGEWARIVAILFSSFLLLASVGMIVYSLVGFFSSSSFGLIPMLATPVIAMIAALTLRTLLRPVSRSDSRVI